MKRTLLTGGLAAVIGPAAFGAASAQMFVARYRAKGLFPSVEGALARRVEERTGGKVTL